MIPDLIEKINNSVIQHGPYNDRIYLIKLSKTDFPNIITTLDALALEKGYSKIFAKVPAFAESKFRENGFFSEAFIPHFYGEHEGVYFMGKYFSQERSSDESSSEIQHILKLVFSKKEQAQKEQVRKITLPSQFTYQICDETDVSQIAEVYGEIFPTYPFPIYDVDYILGIMKSNVLYFSVLKDKNIIALSSSEMDSTAQNVEMTDFATLPECRGNNLSTFLLQQMETEMAPKGYKTAYTIARSLSIGMNMTFAKLGYEYAGTLKKNTNICGSLESMNVWYKFLQPVPLEKKYI